MKSYIKYRRNRVNAHGIHSPFVFEFYNQVLLKARETSDSNIKQLRKELGGNATSIRVEDHGAGSVKNNRSSRTIKSIAKNASVNAKFGKLLLRIADYYKLHYAVELGTSLGLGTCYIASSAEIKKVITVEGSPEIANVARQNFERLRLDKIIVKTGRFEDHLEATVAGLPSIDLVYIDGNHRYQPTIDYFNFFIDRAHDNTFIIFDDIYWSAEMTRAWEEICASPKVNVSMDLFRMGIVCKRPKQAKQHFILKY